MIDINKQEEINIKEIFGKKRYEKYLKNYPILENEDVSAWIRDKIDNFTQSGKDAKKFLISSYLGALQQYCNYNEVKDPSRLLTEELDNRNLRVKKYLHFLLNAKSEDDLNQIKEIGFRGKPSETSITNLIQSRIKSFYSARASAITFGMKTALSGKNEREISLTKSMIKKIKAKFESPEYRLICKFQTQTGLRISDILGGLTSGDYIIEKYREHYFIRNFKTMKASVIINYMFFSEELTNLIQSTYAVDDITQLDLKTILLTKNKTTIYSNDYLGRLKAVVKDLGISGNVKTHSFRKYFSSQVRKCKQVDDEFKEHLMGHTSFNLSQAYNNNLRDIDWFYTEWLKIESLICVECIDRTSDLTKQHNAQITELKEKNIQLEGQIKQVITEKLELKEEMNVLTEQYRKMAKILDKIVKNADIDVNNDKE